LEIAIPRVPELYAAQADRSENKRDTGSDRSRITRSDHCKFTKKKTNDCSLAPDARRAPSPGASHDRGTPLPRQLEAPRAPGVLVGRPTLSGRSAPSEPHLPWRLGSLGFCNDEESRALDLTPNHRVGLWSSKDASRASASLQEAIHL
jgi:hypothetical protein